MDDIDWDKKHLNEKRTFLIEDPLPQKISSEPFAKQHPNLGRIDTVEKLAREVRCARTTLHGLQE